MFLNTADISQLQRLQMGTLVGQMNWRRNSARTFFIVLKVFGRKSLRLAQLGFNTLVAHTVETVQ